MNILPNEIVIRVLLCCSYRDILAFASTCRKYSNIVSKSINLQLHIELEANGLQVVGGCDISDHSLLLQKLQRYRDAWLDLSFMAPINRDCGEENMSLWELRDGAFAKAFSTSGSDMEADSVLITSLNAERNKTRISFGVVFNEFTLDSNQDLIVLAGVGPQPTPQDLAHTTSQGWIRICSLVTGQAHPHAKRPLLNLKLGFRIVDLQPFDVALEIKGELLVIKFASAEDFVYEILVWNWKTGRPLNRIGCDRGVCDFVSLDRNHLVVWSARGANGRLALSSPDLLIYEQIGLASIERGVSDDGTFDISTFPKLSPAFTFQFPTLRALSRISVRGLLLRSDYGTGTCFATSLPFANSKALTLGLTMTLILEGSHHMLRIFVDACQLTRHLEQGKRQSISKLIWNEWGEHATRWFEVDNEFSHWVCWIFGSRYVSNAEQYLSVIDFHSPTVRRHAGRYRDTYFLPERSNYILEKMTRRINTGYLPITPGGEVESLGCDWPDKVARHDDSVVVVCVTAEEATSMPYFEQPAISRLPYRMVTRVQTVNVREDWLINGTQLIGIDYDFGPNPNNVTVYGIQGLDEVEGSL
ncbi:hypothetical protein FRC12_000327 [Ceratobasidium sp. 428]|nr:hypothetical protein FRC12_000327 [Ceratobasidium sp. 428]